MVINMGNNDLRNLSEAMAEMLDDVNFYYHLTGKENGNSINENGLLMEVNKLSSTTIPLDDSFYEDPEHFVDFEVGSPQTRSKDIMVIVGCDDGQEQFLIRENDEGEYFIPSENILGYVNIDEKEFYANMNSMYEIESMGYGR